MKYFVPLCLLVLLISGLGCSASGESTLQVVAGELNMWDSWTINPCKYTYEQNGTEVVKTTVNNLSNKRQEFDMGNGQALTVPAYSSKEYKYKVQLVGQTERIRITRLVENQSGLSIQETLVLKIEPR